MIYNVIKDLLELIWNKFIRKIYEFESINYNTVNKSFKNGVNYLNTYCVSYYIRVKLINKLPKMGDQSE